MPIDEAKLNEFLGRAVPDMAASWSAALVIIGDRLGLYQAMAGAGPLTPAEVAARSGTSERYVTEWLCNQAAGGIVDYDPPSGCFTLTDEAAYCLADEESPVFLPGAYQLMSTLIHDEAKICDAFRSGDGVGWHEHHGNLYTGTERFFRPGYNANLVASWIPALDGVAAKLEAGATVADLGCGHGASTVVMARAYPRSRFVGFDYHRPSIDTARKRAAEAGVGASVSFEVASATGYGGGPYDLVAFFDSLHDMGDPVAAAAHVLDTLAPDGTLLLVEPYANDRLEDNCNPVGRIYYAASTFLCVPSSLAQDGRAGLGNQVGETRLRELILAAGFTRFRRAAETPFNLIFEARP